MKGIISYRGIQRIETYPVARTALREAVLNAIVHKDYSTGIPIQIRVYMDKINIFNSGGLPDGWTVEKLLSQHESNPRNPVIAGVFYRAGLIETWGRGIEKIITACHEEGKPEPLFEASKTGIRILFRSVTQSQVGNTSEVNVGIKLNDTQMKIINLMKEDGTISSETIAEKLGMTARGVRKNIEILKNLGIIDRVGARKKGSWIVKNV